MDNSAVLGESHLSVATLAGLAGNPDRKVTISENARHRIAASRADLVRQINEGARIYGCNTGMGGFVGCSIPPDKLTQLQENVINAVQTNVGSFLSPQVVRAAMICRINSLIQGNSGISLETVDKLVALYNSGVLPCIPEKGSLGSSGDLGPLACIALVATGRWKAHYQDQLLTGSQALEKAGLEPASLGVKEGLSLMNGTGVSAALACLVLDRASRLVRLYDLVSALSFEALAGKVEALNPLAHECKPHRGQMITASQIFGLLQDSSAITQGLYLNPTVEDPYSLRCTPQILGPVRDSIKHALEVLEVEINGVNDNPVIVPCAGDYEIYHVGHFHAQYVSMAMDQVAIALTTLSNLTERRIDRFMDAVRSNGLPPFLCKVDPGVRHGLGGGQFMAASVTAESRALCIPVSIQSLPTTAGFQDIVPFSLPAARKAESVLINTTYAISFELMAGGQAVDQRGFSSASLSRATSWLYSQLRSQVPYIDTDQPLTDHLESIAKLLSDPQVLEAYEGCFTALEL